MKLLNKLKIFTLQDLITYFPRNHEDRSIPKKISDCKDGEEVLIRGVATSKVIETFARKLKIYKLIVRDGENACTITWFNQPYLKNIFKVGHTYNFYGRIETKLGRYEMKSPVYDEVGEDKNTGKIIPIYPLTYGISQNTIRKIIENGIDEVYGNLEETLPDYILKKYNLININEAIKQIHFPSHKNNFIKARYRLVFEELLGFQLALLSLNEHYKLKEKGIQFSKDVKMSDVINILPFKLTKAQLRVLEEIDNNMEKATPMNRLLQGDVGSGKTVVSIISAYKAVKSGYQVAIMAPTAILATQHMEEFSKILAPLGIKCELLLGATTAKNKKDILERLQNGEIDVLIGTHALITENVTFKNLGLVVTDEQHRFGVKQRTAIAAKGNNPDTLVMTATPIPRTLALILYGDLDISIIDELPPNRKKIETYAVTKSMEERINNFIKKNIDEGRQIYVVCPLVEEKEEEDETTKDLKAVKEWTKIYKEQIFPEYRVECVYGKMKQKEKDEIMQKFKDGEIDILVSTTVIEVGVNVPNANIMVVENADRFGLAQLHQLRGRVGRGQYQSYCVLKYNSKCSQVGKERMKTMQETNDGFVIAEKDLELRGTGEFFGTRQHGIPEFKIANLFVDMPMLKSVQSVALKIESEDKGLTQEKNKRLRKLVDNKLKQSVSL